MRVGKWMIVVGLLAVLCAATGQTQETAIVLTPVKYDGLKQEVVKRRGKVLLVDFWGSFCFPCMTAMPKFIAMHQKYASKGFEVITVSIDDPSKVESVKAAEAFLRRARPSFPNFLLDEAAGFCIAKLDCKSLPCYFVFDRQGRWVRFGGVESTKGVDYEELERVVVGLLEEK